MEHPANPDFGLRAPAPGAAFDGEILLLACAALALVAVVAIMRVIAARKETRAVSRTARVRADALHEFLQMVRTAEQIAGIGIWQYDPRTGRQYWSDGMKRLFGIEDGDVFVEGDAETLLFAHDVDMVGAVNRHAADTGPFALDFEIRGIEAQPRAITVQACNLKDGEGEVARVVAVVRHAEQQCVTPPRQSGALVSLSGTGSRHAAPFCDPLTGLANRRLVMAELDRRVMASRISEMPLVMAVFEVDYFPRINAEQGSAFGDSLLRTVARIAVAQGRDSDLFGRVGDFQFAWIVPGASDRMARIMTERLRLAIARDAMAGDATMATISIGYAALKPDDTALSLFARADNALREARGAGANRVRMAA